MQQRKPGDALPFEKCENFRELGGYRGADGRHVRYGVFFRSPALAKICTEADREYFNSFGIRTVFDFRSQKERQDLPDPEFPGVHNIAVSALLDENGEEINFDLEQLVRTEEGLHMMIEGVYEGYAKIPFDNPAYRRMFESIRADETPLLFHCTAGKDRTGVAAAIILKMLGVSREDIISDYMRTNENRENGYAEVLDLLIKAGHPQKRCEEAARLAVGVRQQSIEDALDAIDAKYPRFEDYLSAEFGIGEQELAEIRARYLE